MTNYLVPVYVTYLAATVGLCVWLARTLYRNGETFLAGVFDDRPEVAHAVNRLLVTGFAMFELGFGLVLLGGGVADDPAEALEVLTRKLGVLLVTLAVVHFANVLVFHWIGDRRRPPAPRPPFTPQPWGGAPPPPPAPTLRPNPPTPQPTVG